MFNIPIYHKIKYINSNKVELPVAFPINIPSEATKNIATKVQSIPEILFAVINDSSTPIFISDVNVNRAIKEHKSCRPP